MPWWSKNTFMAVQYRFTWVFSFPSTSLSWSSLYSCYLPPLPSKKSPNWPCAKPHLPWLLLLHLTSFHTQWSNLKFLTISMRDILKEIIPNFWKKCWQISERRQRAQLLPVRSCNLYVSDIFHLIDHLWGKSCFWPCLHVLCVIFTYCNIHHDWDKQPKS